MPSNIYIYHVQKNMCFSDRFSNHGFWANFMRLITSSIAYEMFLMIKTMIRKTKFHKAHKWQIDNIRLYRTQVIKSRRYNKENSEANSMKYKSPGGCLN